MNKSKSLAVAAILAVGISFTACNNGKSPEEIKLQSQLDSLSLSDSLHKEDITSMADFVTTMSDGLDSITGAEKDLKNMGVEGKKIDKAHLRTQLSAIKQIIARQKARINALEASVAKNKTQYSQRVQKLIDYYKTQLDEKDAQIADLQKQLDDKNTNIAQLTESVNQLTTEKSALNQTVADQKQVISEQDASIHKAYVTIGTSKQLKAKGLLKGGFLAKNKVDVSSLSANGFDEIDVRNYNDIRLKSSNPKVMTQMPAGSYTIIKNNDGTSVLHINNVDKFWSVSKYLIIKL